MTDRQTFACPIVFLDIDGVLQPISSQDRFNHDMDALQADLVSRVHPGYRELNKYDIAAVRHDWFPAAVDNLKALCASQRGTQIVVSSSWRDDKTLEMLKLLFKIHDLDHLIVDMTPDVGPRDLEVEEFLVAHPEIERFVIVDDHFADDLGRRFGDRFVNTRRYLDADALEKAKAALRKKPRSKKEQTAIDSFEALLRGDPALTKLDLDIATLSVIRRQRGCSRPDLLQRLCDGVSACPKLQSVTVRGIRYNYTWSERDKANPVGALKAALAKNPSVELIDLEDEDPAEMARRKSARGAPFRWGF